MTDTRRDQAQAEEDAFHGVTHVPLARCFYCGDPYVRRDGDAWPYCSPTCAIAAEVDSEEDR